MELIERVNAALMHIGGRVQLRDGRVNLRCINGPSSDAIRQRQQDLILNFSRGSHACVEATLYLLDLGAFGIVNAQRIEAHCNKLRHAAKMMVLVVLSQLGSCNRVPF